MQDRQSSTCEAPVNKGVSGTTTAPTILYIHGASDLYGASRSLLRLVTRIDRRRFNPCVVLPDDGPLVGALKRSGVPVIIMPSLSVVTRHVFHSLRLLQFLLRLPLSVLALASLIRRERVSIVHSNVGVAVSAGAAAKLAGVPHIWHVRDSFREFGVLWKGYARYILWSSVRVVCVSHAVAAQFQPGSPKVVVVHNGLPLEEFEGVTDARVERFRNKYDLLGKRLVGVVGRIKFQRKGQEIFVQAAQLLKDKFDDVRFLIIGSPFPGNESHLQRLRELIEELRLCDRVILTGDVDDIQAAYRSLDVLVLPSCQPEPFAGVVLEAMALGVPVVGTRTGGTVEQIEDGISGLLADPDNVEMLAGAIERLLTDRGLRESICDAAHARVAERFSFETMWQKLEALYASVLAQRTAPSTTMKAAGPDTADDGLRRIDG